MSHLFISYSRKDIEFVDELVHRLEENHFEVWWDRQGIEVGDYWKDRIVSEIETCSAFVIILSPRSAHSLWVMRELTYAREFEKPIFPLFLEENQPWPLVDDRHCANSIDELLQGLRQLARLYISYVSEDESLGLRLMNDLAALGADVWQHRGEAASDQEGLNSSQIMLLAISPESMQSQEIKTQWSTFDTARKTIIPLLFRRTIVAPKLRDKLPYVDFLNQDYEIAFSQLYGLLETLGVHLNEHERVAIPPQPPLPLNGYDMINQAQKAIWISGIALDIFSRRPDVVDEAINRNPPLDIRLLMLDLNAETANETGAWTGLNPMLVRDLPQNLGFESWVSHQIPALTPQGRWVAQRLYENRRILKCIREKAADRVEIRTVPFRLGTAHFIIDPYSEEGMLTASPYFYHIDEIKATQPATYSYSTSPIFLSKSSPNESDLWWFDQYVQEFERLWARATPLKLE